MIRVVKFFKRIERRLEKKIFADEIKKEHEVQKLETAEREKLFKDEKFLEKIAEKYKEV